ncbi:arylesterase [Falsirhodobacter sp. 20TX0035]|uniref:arylesterase n=1 Tax=Falsirhodobacter sp. 20TX0035 TaxID=3022019 RepID=UPI0023305182|nr:arylesterase [Falsirhodobacter sp. 20TX0035]MDB6452886.1 arylesterase [Falsirhodobacter sp. 20TX0035]
MKLSHLFATGCKPLVHLRNLGVALCLGATPALADPVTVVALGDSLTQGYGLPAEQGFVPVLQSWLNDHGAEATVVNAGVSGDTTAGGLARTDWALTPDADAMILNLGGNDLLRGLDPATSRANLDAILDKADARGLPVLLLGLRAPGNYGPGFQQAFNAMYADLAQEHGALFVPDYLGPVTEGDRLNLQYIQGDGIHPNAEGVTRLVEAVGPAVLDLLNRVN